MAKRSAQGGSIRQRPDGRWEARFTYVDELGVTRRKSVYGPTRKSVKDQLHAAQKAADEGTYRDRQRYTLEAWFNEWINVYCVDLKPRTIEEYKKVAKLHIVPALGPVQLTAITPETVKRFVNQLTAAGKSPKTVKNIHGVLHSCLKQAVINGYIVTNPAANTPLPKMQKRELSPVMDDDLKRFVAACQDDRHGRLYLVALFTGLRQSELLGLQWSDIDFDAGTIHVQRQLQRLQGRKYVLVATKNKKGRVVPFSPSVANILKAERRQQSLWRLSAGEVWCNDDGFVFTNEIGEHLKHQTLEKHFHQFRSSIGLDQTRFHDLRHSCAIMALQSGCSVKAVSDMLGHYSSAFTMDVYADVSKAMQKDTQDRMESMFQAASK